MNCENVVNHKKHICALKRQELFDVIAEVTDKPTVQCRNCGAMANSSQNLCAAHLLDEAPNVEGGHGVVGLEEIGERHAG